jgi:hypothetical protein
MIEETTGRPYLVEVNPRSTPLCHLSLGPGRDPVGALAARLSGRDEPDMVSPDGAPDLLPPDGRVAFFPQAWLQAPADPVLRTALHDVPWADTALLRELLRLPYPERGWEARLLAWYRHHPTPTAQWDG